MEENLNIWDFSLTEEETNEISTLDIGHSEIIDHSLASTAKWLNTWKIQNKNITTSQKLVFLST